MRPELRGCDPGERGANTQGSGSVTAREPRLHVELSSVYRNLGELATAREYPQGRQTLALAQRQAAAASPVR